ncbi:hypothetical protein PPYR_14507 [Photinus pyralis]|uniref:GST N-terminal domain-containing protein n=1 Tax=Photinus pyralis TaxID=7054 RepID=A0A5N4A5J7_PHOPY|nr:pyrimidodiazepine synthase-like [Photinus pyralis]KAB0792548.1 hypothetical protein PPYR_14507 [Photinus pyralis]
MGEKHLRSGSEFPQKVNNGLRLYSTNYCPYAQRVRIVIAIKSIPCEIVNVHCLDKPEWISTLHLSGKVPIFDAGLAILTDSLLICNYLDEEYPKPVLHSKKIDERDHDSVLLRDFDDLLVHFDKVLNNHDLADFLELLKHVERYEEELGKRGKYFGGCEPRMIDFMFWPWAERAPLFERLFPGKVPNAEALPNLYSWCAAMREHPILIKEKTKEDSLILIHDMIREGKTKEIDFDI